MGIMSADKGKAKKTVPSNASIHPFLRGNFMPVTQEYISHACTIEGSIPVELLGGQYIRNGGNPIYPPEKGRHYHWFDGDGMLHGVLFPSEASGSTLYTNRHLATSMLSLALLLLRSPVPSIALLISPMSSIYQLVHAVVEATLSLVRSRVSTISVANTAVIWWGQGMGSEAAAEMRAELAAEAEAEGKPGSKRRTASRGSGYKRDHRLLATCESGPPMEVRVPELETVRWDRLEDSNGESLGSSRGKWAWLKRFSVGAVSEDWMTAHPRVDPVDGSLIFYSTPMFSAPHFLYSVIDRKGNHLVWKAGVDVGRPKMMHDFAATRTHTIIMNLPLTMSPSNFVQSPPVPLIHFDRTLPSEFIIFPRLLGSDATPQPPCHFFDPEPSMIFHSANSWDETDSTGAIVAVNMLGCRFRSAKLVYSAGAVEVPKAEVKDGDIVMLHYHRFLLPPNYTISPNPSTKGTITHSFPLSPIPIEFPSPHPELDMQDSQFIYACTMREGTFDERLGGAAKVDALVKVDVRELTRRGRERGEGKSDVPVDGRSAPQILRDWKEGKGGAIEIFPLPEGWFAQEPRFVPRRNPTSEDDGYLLSYVYDEQYLSAEGDPSTAPGTGSELWVIDAKRMHQGMDAVICRVKLPQRVPYGLHGTFLPPSLTRNQRPLPEPLAPQPLLQTKLAHSRLRYLVSILFDRPSSRHMSRFEHFVLTIMWPGAVGLLGLALLEILGAWFGVGGRGSTRGGWSAVVRDTNLTGSADASGLGWEEKGREMMGRSGAWPVPQVFAVILALGTAVLRSGMWRGAGTKGSTEVVEEELAVEDLAPEQST